MAVDDYATIYVGGVQMFEEQIEPAEGAQVSGELAPRILGRRDTTPDERLTAAQALDGAKALGKPLRKIRGP